MAKQAILILQEASSTKDLDNSKAIVQRELGRQGYGRTAEHGDMIFKLFSYQSENPEELTYHLGQLVKFLARPDGKPDLLEDEELTEEELTFRQQLRQFWDGAKPELKKLAKEIWYSKEQLKRMAEGQDAGQGRISTGSVKINERKKDQA